MLTCANHSVRSCGGGGPCIVVYSCVEEFAPDTAHILYVFLDESLALPVQLQHHGALYDRNRESLGCLLHRVNGGLFETRIVFHHFGRGAHHAREGGLLHKQGPGLLDFTDFTKSNGPRLVTALALSLRDWPETQAVSEIWVLLAPHRVVDGLELPM